jgi:hypothetical protein
VGGYEFAVAAVAVGEGAGVGSIVDWPVGVVVPAAVAAAVVTGVGVGVGIEAVAVDVGATLGLGGSAAVDGVASPGPANSATSNSAFPARLPKLLRWESWVRFIFCSARMVRFASAAYMCLR